MHLFILTKKYKIANYCPRGFTPTSWSQVWCLHDSAPHHALWWPISMIFCGTCGWMSSQWSVWYLPLWFCLVLVGGCPACGQWGTYLHDFFGVWVDVQGMVSVVPTSVICFFGLCKWQSSKWSVWYLPLWFSLAYVGGSPAGGQCDHRASSACPRPLWPPSCSHTETVTKLAHLIKLNIQKKKKKTLLPIGKFFLLSWSPWL